MVRVVRCRVVDAGTLTQAHRLMRKAASAAVKMVVRRSCLDFTVAAYHNWQASASFGKDGCIERRCLRSSFHNWLGDQTRC